MRKLLIFCIYILLSLKYSFSQSWQWAKSGGGGDFDHGIGVAVDTAGNSYMTGNYASGSAIFGSYTLPINGWNEIFIAKYDSNGNILWAKSAGGNNTFGHGEGGSAIVVDQSGNCYVTGNVTGSGSFDTIAVNGDLNGSFFIAKYDMNGNCIWVKTIAGGGSVGSIGWAITLDPLGNLYTSGSFSGTVSFDSFTLSTTAYDAFVAKYDTSGSCIWVKQMYTTYGADGRSVVTDNNFNCYVSGGFRDTMTSCGNTFTSANSNVANSFICKYDSVGNCVWTKTVTGAYNNSFSIGADSLNNLYITGAFRDSSITFDSIQLTSLGGYDYFIAKYSPNGNCIWAEQGGGSANDLSYSIATSSSGDNYIVGRAFNTHSINNCNLNGNNFFISKIDKDGNCDWNIETNALGLGNTYAICMNKTETNLFTTGSFTNNANFGTTTLTSVADNDAFIAKLNVPTSGIQKYNSVASFIIYPNPSDGTYTMEVSRDLLKSKMFIYDVSGKEIFQTILAKENTTVDIPFLSQGIYIVRLQTKDGNNLQRSIVKQ